MKKMTLLLAILGLLLASSANASEATFTKAEANREWTAATFEGTIRWDACTAKACRWTPYLFVIPVTSSCDATSMTNSGDGQFVWAGPTRTTAGTFPFKITNGQIIRGLRGQKTCFTARYLRERRDLFCEMDNPPAQCPTVVDEWASAFGFGVLLTEAGTSQAEALVIARDRFARKYGRSWRAGTQKRVRCRPMTTIYRCSATWKLGRSVKRGTVAVPR
jgi:hypothetical protein